jgi:riboflavin synthase
MFSGIVEAKARLLKFTSENPTNQSPCRIIIEKPINFNDLRIGDSIAVNGICLTVEAFDEQGIQFCLGRETLQITGWGESELRAKPLNLERSMRANERVHGHFVTGHVDTMARVTFLHDLNGCRDLKVELSAELSDYFWRKGSLTINGVSLTINDVSRKVQSSEARSQERLQISVTLIPETLLRTNLSDLKLGDVVTIEMDQFARALVHLAKAQLAAGSNGLAFLQPYTKTKINESPEANP